MALTKTSLLNIANRILRYLGKDQITNVSTVNTGDAGRLLYCMDTILSDIYREMSWDFTQSQDTSLSLTDGTRLYDVPDEVDINRIKSILLIDNTTPGSGNDTDPLIEIPYQDFVGYYNLEPESSIETTGLPLHYMLYRGKIYLGPCPGDNGGDGYSLMIHSVTNYNRLTWTNTTTTNIPIQYEQVLDAGVLAMFALDPNDKMMWESKYSKLLDKMVSDYTTTRKHSINLG